MPNDHPSDFQQHHASIGRPHSQMLGQQQQLHQQLQQLHIGNDFGIRGAMATSNSKYMHGDDLRLISSSSCMDSLQLPPAMATSSGGRPGLGPEGACSRSFTTAPLLPASHGHVSPAFMENRPGNQHQQRDSRDFAAIASGRNIYGADPASSGATTPSQSTGHLLGTSQRSSGTFRFDSFRNDFQPQAGPQAGPQAQKSDLVMAGAGYAGGNESLRQKTVAAAIDSLTLTLCTSAASLNPGSPVRNNTVGS